jgi:hypothetical protein
LKSIAAVAPAPKKPAEELPEDNRSRTLVELGDATTRVWIVDTFEGMVAQAKQEIKTAVANGDAQALQNMGIYPTDIGWLFSSTDGGLKNAVMEIAVESHVVQQIRNT